MENKLVSESNALIAEFMGWKIDNSFPDKDRVWRSPQGNCELASTMKFHSSWDWLIPVLKKCHEAGAPTSKIYNIEDRAMERIGYVAIYQDDIMDIFISVSRHIKWYNEEKNKIQEQEN